MKLCVVGTGYVGLVAGSGFAEFGNDVVCVDIDEGKIDQLRAGIVPIYEPGLEEILRRNLREERLRFSTDLRGAVRGSRIVFIAVGTPDDGTGAADLGAVFSVAREIGRSVERPTIVVTKSTVPVGTGARIREIIRGETDEEVDVVANPEFLKEGAAVEDFMRPDRVVVGTDSPRVWETMKVLYAPFVRTGNPIICMGIESAEMTKYAANALLATRIAFMNEVANLCERVGADVTSVRRGLSTDRRIGKEFLFPGPGYGGSCFPKDVRALARTAREVGVAFPILEAVDGANERQKEVLAGKVSAHFQGDVAGRVAAVWGLAFKARTDDIRESPAITTIERLLQGGMAVRVYDPAAMANARGVLGDRVEYAESSYDAVEGAHVLIVVTEWNEFRNPDFDRILGAMSLPVIVDGRNIYEPGPLERMGFTYYAVGRGTRVPVRA